MAEGFLFNMIGKLISQLGSTMAENMRMKDDLEKLMDNMTEIKAVVLDAEEQQGTNHQVEVWLDKLKDALDAADNLLDDFSFEDKKRQVLTKDCIAEVCIFLTSSKPLLISFKLAPRVRDIGKKLEVLNVEKRSFMLTNRNPEERVVKLRETHSFIREEYVIGREKEKEYLVNMLNTNLKMLPSRIDMLKHLRYLNLGWSEQFEMLPRSITKLYNLETLILTGCSKLRELPSDIWKLISLRHLQLHNCCKLTYMPHGIGQLSNLQTLTQFVLDKERKQSGGSSELRGLNQLRNDLEIKGLECLRDDPSKSKEINLTGKSNLKTLKLTWNTKIVAEDNDKGKDYLILQGLLPNHNIKSFIIQSFGGVVISDSINPFTNLLTMQLGSCMKLQFLPSLHLLLHLKSFTLYNLPCLEWIDNNISDDNSSTFFPSLKMINLNELPNLKGWWKRCEEGKQKDIRHQLKSLNKLFIVDCPNLVTLPPHKYIQDIHLDGVNEKIVEQGVYDSKVEILDIRRINGLKSLSKVLQHLTVLRDLRIYNCQELDMCNDDEGCYSMQWKQLRSLRLVTFHGIPKMEYVPDELQHVTTLESLKIWNCSNLKSIPEWTTLLQRCEIGMCPQLVSLPKWVKVIDPQ